VTKGKIEEHCPWRFDLEHDISCHPHIDGGDTHLLDYSGGQTYGLVIQHSGGDEENDVDLSLFQLAHYFGHHFLLQGGTLVQPPARSTYSHRR